MNLTNRIIPDLNLLRVFVTVWDARSLTVAAERLSLTQPAVSHALRRLRSTFNDPLFVRGPGGMVPTDMASRLHGPLSEALQIIFHAVHDSERFESATAQRVFRIAMSDVSEFFFLPTLMRRLADVAPAVQLVVIPLDPVEVGQSMRIGAVDVAIGYVPGLEDEVISHALFSDPFVCLVRANHPMVVQGPEGMDFGALSFVYADTTAAGHHLVERWLTEIGVKRRIALRLGHFMVAPNVVRDTDHAVIFPNSVARSLNGAGDFALLPLPPGQPVVDIQVHTHARFSGDAGIRWLRDSLIELFGRGRFPEGI